jgi:hypothetical protein
MIKIGDKVTIRYDASCGYSLLGKAGVVTNLYVYEQTWVGILLDGFPHVEYQFLPKDLIVIDAAPLELYHEVRVNGQNVCHCPKENFTFNPIGCVCGGC